MKHMNVKQHTFSDGTVIPPNTPIAIPITPFQAPQIYPDHDAVDGQRFFRMREQPGNENKRQFVTTSPEMYAFGYGANRAV